MPTEEFVYTEAEIRAQGREAHLLRTRGRITVWKARLQQDGLGEADRQIVLEELALYERQLREPFTKRTLKLTPQKEEGPVAAAWQAVLQEVADLKAQVMALTKPKTEDAPAEEPART